MRRASGRAGMTLVEGLLYAALSVIVLGGLSTLMVQTSRMEDRTDRMAGNVVEATRLYRRVLGDVAQAVAEDLSFLDRDESTGRARGLRLALADDGLPGAVTVVEYRLDPARGEVERSVNGVVESRYGLGPGAVLGFPEPPEGGYPGLHVEVNADPGHPGRAVHLDATLPCLVPPAGFPYWN